MMIEKEYCLREDAAWNEKAQKWLEKKRELQRIEEEEKLLRKELVELANAQSSCGSGVRLTFSNRRGLIDYGSIPVLKDIDLEQYRKPSTTVCSLSAT